MSIVLGAKPLAVVLAPEEVTSTFDRRILQQISLLHEHGWNVFLLAHNSGVREISVEINPTHTSLLIPRRGLIGLPVDASLAAKIGYAFGYYADQIKKVALGKAQSLKSKFSFKGSSRPKVVSKKAFIYDKALDVFNVKGVDLVLCCDLPAGEVAIELAQKNGAALWFDAHEHYSAQSSLSLMQREILAVQEQRIVSIADRSYTVTPQLAKIMSSKFGHDKSVGFLPNSLRVTEVTESGKLKKILGIPLSDKVLLYHGGFFPDRNLDKLLEGFQKSSVANTHLVMMGYGDRDKLLGGILDINDKRVHFLSAVPSNELLAYVIDADAIVIPYPGVDVNTLNCFPNKLGDAIALQKPILINEELIFLNQYIDTYHAGISANFNDVRLISDAINSLNLEDLKPKWLEIENDLGWTFHSKTFSNWLKHDFA